LQQNPAKPSETKQFTHLANKSGKLSSFPICVCKGILLIDCWNFDEIGFWIGYGGKQIVLTLGAREKPKKDRKSLTITSKTNRDYLISIEAISAADDIILPMLILKTTQHLF
jgi:hypothetical protein